jgi:hypothetical protein
MTIGFFQIGQIIENIFLPVSFIVKVGHKITANE